MEWVNCTECIYVDDNCVEARRADGCYHGERKGELAKVRTIVMEGPDEFKTTYYTPTCKFGYRDCIYDDAYIKATYPNWYEALQQRKGIQICDCCIQGDRYDDEDK